MDNRFNLPNPSVINNMGLEDLIQLNIDTFKAFIPDWEPTQSDMLTIVSQSLAYKELHDRKAQNEKIKKMLPHFSSGADLDNFIFAFYGGLTRIENETDKEFLDRAILSINRSSTAGAIETYKYYTYKADAKIDDVKVKSAIKDAKEYLPLFLNKDEDELLKSIKTFIADFATVEIYIASKEDIDDTLILKVTNALNEERVRPLSDKVIVKQAKIKNVSIKATIEIYDLNSKQTIKDEISNNFNRFFKIGEDLICSEVISNLHIDGVYKVSTNINEDVGIEDTQIIKLLLELDFKEAIVR